MAALSLAFDVIARDQGASRTLNNVGDSAERAGKKGSKFGDLMRSGMAKAAGAVAGLALGAAFKTFIEEANDAAKVGRLTEAVVKSTGGAAQITAAQVGDLAEALSNKSAVDDELIQSGANVLLTFTKIRNEAGAGNDVFNQATEAALNMSAALGTDMQAASIQLGKALNDPIKGVTALGKAGVSFTEQQKEQIRTLVESGNTLDAQKIILAEMAVQFGGAAEAAASPLERLKVVAGNLGEQIGTVLLPYVDRFATFVSDKALPAVSNFLKEFESGEGAGGKFRDVLTAIRDVGARLGPVLADVGKFLAYLWTEGQKAADILMTGLKPVWDELVLVWNSDLKPAFQEILTVLRDELGPIFGSTAKEQGSVIEQSARMTVVLAQTLLPTIVKAITLFAAIIRVIAAVIGPIKDAWLWSSRLAAEFTAVTVQAQRMVRDTIGGVGIMATAVSTRFQQIKSGVAQGINSAIATVRGLPGQISGALGNLGSLLMGQGRAIINGLISGVKAGIGALRSTFTSITNMIPDWKGPMDKDKTLLAPAGHAIMGGLIGSVRSEIPALRSVFGEVTDQFAMPGAGAMAAGRPMHITVQSVLDGRVIAQSTGSHLGALAESGSW